MKTSWSKILFIVSDVVIAVYLILAFTSFDKKGDSRTVCSKVNIEIADNATGGFLDAKVIKERLQKAGCYPIGKRLDEVNARGIEEMLRQSPFVKTAECYKTEGGHVYISVTQRMPVIRIKADNGDDYYVDDNDCIMPRTNYTSDLIIATGNISQWYATNYISPLGKAIMQNDLWKNLIEQVNVLPDHGVEIVPRIGDHVVYVGQLPDGKDRKKHEKAIGDFIDKKMTRLVKFYKYGLSQVGWNKYSYINIEFDNQIICKRKEHAVKNDDEPETLTLPGSNVAIADGPTEEPSAGNSTAANAENGNKTEPGQKADAAAQAKKAEPDVKKTETASRKKTNTASKKEEQAGKKADSSSKKPDTSSKKADSSSRKPDTSSKKADSSSKKTDSSSKKTKNAARSEKKLQKSKDGVVASSKKKSSN